MQTFAQLLETVIHNADLANGLNNEIDNIIDIYNNDDISSNCKLLYAKKYKEQSLINKDIADILNSMNNDEYKIYQHENMLKDRI